MTSILSQENRVVNATNSNAIFSKSKKNFSIFSAIPELAYNLEYFERKKMSLRGRLQKPMLLKCRVSGVSEHLWTLNMLKRPKHCINLHGSIFLIFFDHSERKSALKILFY